VIVVFVASDAVELFAVDVIFECALFESVDCKGLFKGVVAEARCESMM
jgi:hypothetical protein